MIYGEIAPSREPGKPLHSRQIQNSKFRSAATLLFCSKRPQRYEDTGIKVIQALRSSRPISFDLQMRSNEAAAGRAVRV
jgi:hypothetical protein